MRHNLANIYWSINLPEGQQLPMYPINLKMMAKQLLWTHLNVEIIKGGIKYNVEYFFSQIVAVWPNGLRVFKPNTRLPSRGKLVLHFILQA